MRLKIPMAGVPLNQLLTTRTYDFIANVLEDIEGDGCTIEKPMDANGLGWTITLDPYADTPSSPVRPLMPFDICQTKTGWRVWLRDASVFLDNIAATPLVMPGRWPDAMGDNGFSVRAYPPGSRLYVYVLQQGSLFFWTVDTTYNGDLSVIAEIPIGICQQGAQLYRGNIVYYASGDSEPIVFNSARNVYELRRFQDVGYRTKDAFRWEGHDKSRVDIVILEPGGDVNYVRISDMRKHTEKYIERWMEEEIKKVGAENPDASAFDEWYKVIKDTLEERWGFPWHPPAPGSAGYWVGITTLKTDPQPEIVHKWVECDDAFLGRFGVLTASDLKAWRKRLEAASKAIQNADVSVPGIANRGEEAAQKGDEAAYGAEAPMGEATQARQIADEAGAIADAVSMLASDYEAQLSNLEDRLTALEGRQP